MRNLNAPLRLTASVLVALILPSAAIAQQSTTYHLAHQHTIGGSGGWDYLTLDTVSNRLFITRTDRVMVVDPHDGHVVGDIAGLDRGHGVAFAYREGHGFVTSGADSTVTMFDLQTLKVLGKTVAAVDDDAVLYDPATGHVFTFNGDAGSASVIDAVSGKRIGAIDLGGKPEFGVTAGDGKLYVNIEDKNELAEIDANGMRVVRRWSLAPCTSPSGLAIDVANHRLFSVCRNKLMAISDIQGARVVATVPIGSGVDAARYDAGTHNAFASNGDGTLTVVHQDTPDRYHVAQTVTTMQGARTMEIDPRTHTVYTVSAKFGAVAAGQRRPPVLPGTFTLLVLQP